MSNKGLPTLGRDAVEISNNDILLRKFNKHTHIPPLRLLRLSQHDLSDHKANLLPLLSIEYKSYRLRQKVLEQCWQRFCNEFQWLNQ